MSGEILPLPLPNGQQQQQQQQMSPSSPPTVPPMMQHLSQQQLQQHHHHRQFQQQQQQQQRLVPPPHHMFQQQELDASSSASSSSAVRLSPSMLPRSCSHHTFQPRPPSNLLHVQQQQQQQQPQSMTEVRCVLHVFVLCTVLWLRLWFGAFTCACSQTYVTHGSRQVMEGMLCVQYSYENKGVRMRYECLVQLQCPLGTT